MFDSTVGLNVGSGPDQHHQIGRAGRLQRADNPGAGQSTRRRPELCDQSDAGRGRSEQVVRDHPGRQWRRRNRRAADGKKYWLVVVWPNAQTSDNPQGEYTENLIVHHQVHIQGVGPGGFDPGGAFVAGSIIDGAGFNPDNPSGTNWITLLGGLTYSGNPAVPGRGGGDGAGRPGGAEHLRLPADRSTASPSPGARSPTSRPTSTRSPAASTTPYGAAGALITQGGGDVRAQQRPQPAADRQHHPRQRRLVRRRGSRRYAVRRQQPELQPDCSPATRSATTAAPTWPAASACSPAATDTRSPGTRSAGTSPRNMAERSRPSAIKYTSGGDPAVARSPRTASGSTPPTTRAAAS